MIKGINHIGFAVKSIDETLQFLKDAYGAHEVERHSFPKLGQVSSLVKIGDDKFELMEPLGAGVYLQTNKAIRRKYHGSRRNV